MATAAAAEQVKLRKRLEALLKLPENQTCCDCGKRGPRWASANLGNFFCIECSGIHRNLGVHISFVRSVNLDSWTNKQVEFMEQWGNARANAYWEANIPRGFSKPKENDPVRVVEKFIRDKYEHKRFIASSVPPPRDRNAVAVAEPAPVRQSSAPAATTRPVPADPHATHPAQRPAPQAAPQLNLLDFDAEPAPAPQAFHAPQTQAPPVAAHDAGFFGNFESNPQQHGVSSNHGNATGHHQHHHSAHHHHSQHPQHTDPFGNSAHHQQPSHADPFAPSHQQQRVQPQSMTSDPFSAPMQTQQPAQQSAVANDPFFGFPGGSSHVEQAHPPPAPKPQASADAILSLYGGGGPGMMGGGGYGGHPGMGGGAPAMNHHQQFPGYPPAAPHGYPGAANPFAPGPAASYGHPGMGQQNPYSAPHLGMGQPNPYGGHPGMGQQHPYGAPQPGMGQQFGGHPAAPSYPTYPPAPPHGAQHYQPQQPHYGGFR